MAVALSSSVSSPLGSRFSSSSASSIKQFLSWNPNPSGLAVPLPRTSGSVLVLARRRNQNAPVTSSSPSLKRRKKKGFGRYNGSREEDEGIDDDPFGALFNQLEEDLKNDNSPIDDDDDINEEDIDALAQELAEVLGSDDDDGIGLFGSATGSVDDGNGVLDDGDDEEEDEDSEEDERPVKLKNWQLRRLAYALKAGRRKTSIKNLAAELCLERAYVLELLRDPPPNLLMLSATLPDEPPPAAVTPRNKSPEPLAVESSEDVTEPGTKIKEPVYVMQHRWSAQKRLKKVQMETLERVYSRSKRPTNAMISSIVQVTNLPRKRVVKWFEDKRAEDGIPENRAPYQRPV